MSKTVIDLDDDLVERAADVLGTTSKKATVDQALWCVVMEQIRRRHVQRFSSGDSFVSRAVVGRLRPDGGISHVLTSAGADRTRPSSCLCLMPS